MNILVTGANGQVGSALLRTAPVGMRVTGLTHQQLDIGNEQAVAACIERLRPEGVINAAAYTAVERAEDEPAQAHNVNALGPRHLAVAALRHDARLIHLSTDYVFDGQASTPYRPDAPTNPLNVYGRTKRKGEEEVQRILGARGLVLRVSWIYSFQGSNFLKTMLRVMKSGNPVKVVADQIGTPTAATSVAQVIWKLIQRPDIHGLQHWTDAGVASWYDFAVAIAEEATQLGLLSALPSVQPISTAEYPTRAQRPPYSVLDKSALIATLGENPPHWRVSLRRVLQEFPRD